MTILSYLSVATATWQHWVKCPQVAMGFVKYGRELLPPPGNTASQIGSISVKNLRKISHAWVLKAEPPSL
jgi:hypothetical protein